MSFRRRLTWAWPVVPIVAALLFTSGLLLLFDTHPLAAFQAMFEGAFGDSSKTLSVLAFWIPLLLAAAGLLVTFTAGLWNIGVEGQIVMGAIGASWIALKVQAPGLVLIALEVVVAMLAGALWAGLAAVLKTRGRVHEIFGGLALNNLAIIFTNYLISGPWQPPEGGSFRGTQPFQDAALLPLFRDSHFSPLSLVLTLIAFGLVALALRGTFWGLKLKALGKNPYSAFLLGVSSERETILAMMFCGALAGLGGAVRVLSWFDSLRQSISGGIGFLALLVVMLAGYRLFWVPLIAFFFSAVLNGSISLQLRTQLHSSLGGILTGVMVLFVLLFGDAGRLGLGRRPDLGQKGAPEVSEPAIEPLGPNLPGEST
ncbi:MAG: ABC transporter permease [Chloroflexi bacterium]|nr:ABC transporter permease [Chloroflexota bacterium]MCI0648992.1 ABC transporter permease [Chloroflexota bacterium]MCI0729427.1 ABC transporter permease [Chloroflexota bacterium]